MKAGRIAVLGLLWGLPTAAQAMCGCFVPQSWVVGEAELSNAVSQVALVRTDGQTKLTIANDYSGAATDFALIIPIPHYLSESAIRVVDPELFVRLDGATSPDLIYDTPPSCDPKDTGWATAEESADDGGSTPSSTEQVTVKAVYAVGEYEIAILDAEASSALAAWLKDNGYEAPPAVEAALQEYIDAGSLFMAAKVRLAAVPAAGSFLSPLQITYRSDVISLPIRLGTANSPGVQDVVVYAINPRELGATYISNYPELPVETGCMWKPRDGEDFNGFYDRQLSEAMTKAGGAGWFVEYAEDSWSGGDTGNEGGAVA